MPKAAPPVLQMQAVVPATSGSAAASGSGGVSASERVWRAGLSLEQKAGVEMDRMDKLLTDMGLEPFFSVHANRMRGTY